MTLTRRLRSSEAYRLRSAGMPLERRVREHFELTALCGTGTRARRLTANAPTLQTDREYWGIRDQNDWGNWSIHETVWLLDNEAQIRRSGVLEVLKAAGWSEIVMDIEMLIQLKGMKIYL